MLICSKTQKRSTYPVDLAIVPLLRPPKNCMIDWLMSTATVKILKSFRRRLLRCMNEVIKWRIDVYRCPSDVYCAKRDYNL